MENIFYNKIINFRKYEKEYSKSIIENIKSKNMGCKAAYIPSFIPEKPVDYIFIGMEPSFGWWAKDEEIANDMVGKGFVNFLWSIEDFLFHFTINKFLSSNYYITDISKIAMTVENANVLRKEMYPKWIEHLKKEIDIVGSENKKIIFIGRQVESWLLDYMKDYDVKGRIVHFSRQAGRTRKSIAEENMDEYIKFCSSNDFSEERIKAYTYTLLKHYMSNDELIDKVYKKIKERSDFMTDSRKRFIFAYYKYFSLMK